MRMSEEEFSDEEKKKITSKTIEGEILNAHDRDIENKLTVSENIGEDSNDVEEKEELRRKCRRKKFICEDSNSDNDESDNEKRKRNEKVDNACTDWNGKSDSNVVYDKAAVGNIADNYKSKSRRSFLTSDDEVEGENHVSISRSRKNAKFRNKSFVDSDDEKSNFIENNKTIENENGDNESDSSLSNEHEGKCNERKHCFNDDSEAGSDQREVKGKDVSFHRPSKQKDDLKKSKKKALEELVHRKKYGTRKEAIEDNEDLNEDLFKNKDLFSVGNSSESEEEPEAEETFCSVSEEGNESKMSRKSKKEKAPRVKKPTKSMIKEQTSEQQRLLREQKIDLPYHQPELANIKQFLKRVPKLQTPKRVDNNEAVDFQKTSSVQNVFQEKPRLSMDTMEFEEDSSDEVTVVKQDEPKPKERKKLDSFIQRFAKHTKGRKKETKSDDLHDVVITSQTPGLAHEVLKSQLKQRIQEERRRSCQELEKQLKLYHAEDISDDEEMEEEEGEMEDEEVDENDGMDEVEKEVNGNDGIVEVEEEDEELSKWNAEDDRKHLEVQLEEKLEEEKDLEKSDSSADLLSAPLLEKTQRTMNEVNLPEESTQWSDSSSLIAPGQGNCICATATGDVKSTPFTKLLKSGLLDSASKSSVGKGNSVEEKFSGLELPCENTQELYKHHESKPRYNEEESQNVPAGFHFTLDEETQFEEILDSQGNFNDNKRARKASAKKLFDNNSQHSPESMTQLLGFCSGYFGSGTSEAETEKNEEKSEEPAVIKDSGFFDLVDCENEIENAMDFCSGKLSDFKTQHKANSQEKASSPTKIYPSDKANLENAKSNTKKEYSGESKDAGDFIEKPVETQLKPVENQSLVKENDEKRVSVKEDIPAVIEEDQQACEEDGISDGDEEEVDDDNFINDADDEMENGDDCDSESDTENDNGEHDDDKENVRREEPEELQEWKEFVKGETTKKKLNKRAFYEVEAELSGSDLNSADEDLGSEFDEYEVDSEAEEGLPSGDKLRRQVHKIHQRKMIDQDKKEVRLLQELYFEDGDLGVGQARKRNFRWKNVDEVTLNDVNNKSDGEGDEIITTNVEAKMERIEKEKFLQQSQNNSCVNHLDESSQSILNIIRNKEKAKENTDLTRNHTRKSISTGQRKKSGSFLNKNATSIASKTMLKSSSQKTSKSYVFQAVEGQVPSETKSKKNHEQTKSHQPARKRQKIEQQSNAPNPSSIFNLL